MNARVQELLDAAKILQGAGDGDGALRLVEEALRLDPESSEVRQRHDELMGGAVSSAEVEVISPPRRPITQSGALLVPPPVPPPGFFEAVKNLQIPSTPTPARGMRAVRPSASAVTPATGAYPPVEPSKPADPREADLRMDLRRARDLVAFADHTGAIEALERILASHPGHAEAQELLASCRATLTSMYESKLGDLSGKPRPRMRPDEIIWLNLDARAGFLLSQIDGSLSFADLFDLSNMSRLDTARILAQLIEEKVLEV